MNTDIKFEGREPVNSRSSAFEQSLWLTVTSLDQVKDGERVVCELKAEHQAMYLEYFFWRYHFALAKIELERRKQLRDEELVLELALHLRRIRSFLEQAEMKFWNEIRDEYQLWERGNTAIRNEWKVVESPLENGQMASFADMLRMALGLQQPEQEAGRG